jgi:transposase
MGKEILRYYYKLQSGHQLVKVTQDKMANKYICTINDPGKSSYQTRRKKE